jgi:Cys-tRNA synthase (O-phospho-L-seryl-tRNA:Cys-tRNA synthase)
MYAHWLQDLEEKHEFAKNYSTYIGAFSNYNMAQKIMNTENPEYNTTEEEFNQSIENIKNIRNLQEQIQVRKRKVVKD